MMQNVRLILAGISLISFSAVGCTENTPKPPAQVPVQAPVSLQEQLKDVLGAQPTATAQAAVGGKVLQVINAGRYTYLELEAGNEPIWAAVPAVEVPLGGTVTIRSPSLMDNFSSPSLNRTFKAIYFGSGLVTESPISATKTSAAKATPAAKQPDLNLPDGAVSVASVHENVANWVGKRVKVSGEVVKFNAAILGVNWIHIQDGSGDKGSGNHDLTLTTDAQAKVGDTILAEGIVVQDKDFGAGYLYPVILEKVKLLK